MQGKTCVVTGANSGIGKATAMSLARQGAEVVMVCRSRARGEEALQEIREATGSERVVLMLADLASFESLRAFGRTFADKYTSLDVLVNNAGVYVPTRQRTEDGHELSFGVNHLGTYLMTMVLMPQLLAAPTARVVVVSSAVHVLGRNSVGSEERSFYHGMLAYADGKLANIMFANELARRCAGTQVTANSLHPGVVRTGFGQDHPGVFHSLVKMTKAFYSSPESGARTSIFLASDSAVEGVTGQYFVRSKARRPSFAARCERASSRLWALSADLTGADLPL